ncbi:hypothetical protein [Nonomuraea recticatena]|uniref:hypothetical protein n=1 Tax=Nonomuraea recticatena TaxID=46178 RepID=UPI00361F82DC
MIGPTTGAAVATLMALVYKALYSESEQRRLLIDDLVSTRGKLVRMESETARLAERERLARDPRHAGPGHVQHHSAAARGPP